MNTKSKFSYYYSTYKAVAPYYINFLKRAFAFGFCVMTFPVFLLLRGGVFLYRLIRK